MQDRAVWRPDNPEKSVCRPLPNKCLTRTDRRPGIKYKPANETLLSHPFARRLLLVIPQPSICIFTIWHHIAFPKGVTHTRPRVNARSPAFDSCLPRQHAAAGCSAVPKWPWTKLPVAHRPLGFLHGAHDGGPEGTQTRGSRRYGFDALTSPAGARPMGIAGRRVRRIASTRDRRFRGWASC